MTSKNLANSNDIVRAQGNVNAPGCEFISHSFVCFAESKLDYICMTNVVCIFISAWAITLSVLQYRAMREPLDVGRTAEVPTLFLCRKKFNTKNYPFEGAGGDLFYCGYENETKIKTAESFVGCFGLCGLYFMC
ncbi:hypothetical protein ACU52_06455 [Xylanibacter rarus]|uniref:Uncharacterized protein n=1 Tax=Xylanibacter rarus TaxID=1676614 RepID=A0A8E1QXP9_9BACT|nr:hypothetical protein ACU52_06455 [Xylanibacter rarus]